MDGGSVVVVGGGTGLRGGRDRCRRWRRRRGRVVDDGGHRARRSRSLAPSAAGSARAPPVLPGRGRRRHQRIGVEHDERIRLVAEAEADLVGDSEVELAFGARGPSRRAVLAARCGHGWCGLLTARLASASLPSLRWTESPRSLRRRAFLPSRSSAGSASPSSSGPRSPTPGGARSCSSSTSALRGVFVERAEPLPIGETVELRFRLPGNELPVATRCRVAWWRPPDMELTSKTLPSGVGLEFVEIDGAGARAHARVPVRVPARQSPRPAVPPPARRRGGGRDMKTIGALVGEPRGLPRARRR